MASVSTGEMVAQMVAVLREGFEGSPNPWSLFTDGPVESALFGTVEKLSAASASRSVGGSSVAAHVKHVAFGLEASAAFIRGDRSPRDWQQSWAVKTVDDAAWNRLRQELRTGYDAVRKAIESHGTSSVESAAGAVGAVAHVAYHLGAIRQKIAQLP